jgi:hypothetical protein
MENQNNATVAVAPLSLPKGNGTVTGMGETLSGAGPDGMLSLSLPLPVTSVRGAAPSLSLHYNSGGGNGPFGLGWSCASMSISRDTRNGVPLWQDTDIFIGPEGEVLLPELTSTGEVVTQIRRSLRGASTEPCVVTRYHTRIEKSFTRIERWTPQDEKSSVFWVMYTADGGIHCLGKTSQARISNPQNADQIAMWLLEESVSALAEHHYYQYLAEDDKGCSAAEVSAHSGASAQRYLGNVFYGNTRNAIAPFLFDTTFNATNASNWLFCLVFDYGQYGSALYPDFTPTAIWGPRLDCFSRYEYGFEIRTRRLCRQVLMFHRLQALEGHSAVSDSAILCGRLRLQYDHNPVVTCLTAARQDGADPTNPAELPPLEFAWEMPQFSNVPVWQELTDPAVPVPHQRYQLVDLYGEGLAGMLYQDNNAWWYCSPVRRVDPDDKSAITNATTWSAPAPLPSAPVYDARAMLIDITQDGRPDWVVAQPGLQGYFTLDNNKQWSSFIPLNTLPTEFFHPFAQLQDLTGGSRPDLVLIGPKSVRLWSSSDSQWEASKELPYEGSLPLPVTGHDQRRAVVFSDFLGSGQQHLAEIRADGVTVWPNLGRGQFGQPLTLSGFTIAAEQFHPSRIYLADIDGSGTSDILYVHSDRIRVFRNQSGNEFVETNSITLPSGVRFDDTCQLHVGDLQGLGVASILLTLPHPNAKSWCCNLNTARPWLLNAMNNNMGSHHTFSYRSSAQFWLDQKQRATPGEPVNCRLPFPVHVLWQHRLLDEITGNMLTNESRYYQGVWDAKEREFRGFAYVEELDTSTPAAKLEDTPPLLVRRWYATGVREVDQQLPLQYWQGDSLAYGLFTPRLTQWTGTQDQELTTDEDTWWHLRALKGALLRSESYGLDGSALASVPYNVTESRWQSRRLLQLANPVVMALLLENRSYHYERISHDPQISQSVNLAFDATGIPVDSLSIAYPRRSNISADYYPMDSLPADLIADSIDPQQQQAHLTRVRQRTITLDDSNADVWRLGLADEQRTDVCFLDASRVPSSGFNLENLQQPNSVMMTPEARSDVNTWYAKGEWTFAGKVKTYYTAGDSQTLVLSPTLQALVAFTETSGLDQTIYDLTDKVNEATLLAWGYTKMVDTMAKDISSQPITIWGARQGYTDYGVMAQFWRPLAQRATLLTGKTTLTWDPHYCLPISSTDAAGLVTRLTYDYRYMQPVNLIDANDNQHQTVLDGLGRPVASRFSGTENGKATGYSAWNKVTIPLPVTIEGVMGINTTIPLASFSVTVVASWMVDTTTATTAQLSESLESTLKNGDIITASGRLSTLGWQRYRQNNNADADVVALDNWLQQTGRNTRLPPHQLDVITDRYDTDPEQQKRQTIRFSDGTGRLLQIAVLHEDGPALQRTAQGTLAVDQNGALVKTSGRRWAVSGKTEYNNKGLPIRTYQPYFLNDWRYVSDDSARSQDGLYCDTSFYDAIGREISVMTAKGYLRRSRYFPWFSVTEDENDTSTASPAS